MIKFFRNSYLVQYVTIGLLLIALWVPSFITGNVDSAWRSPVAPLYNVVANLFDFWSPAMLIFAMLLMGFEAVFFNSILVSNQLIGRVNTLGAVTFLLLMNLVPTQTTFYPFLIASVFLLMLIHTLFAIYQTPRPELYLFNAGLFLALATMCWFPTLLLALWGIVALSIVHKGSIRLHLIPFIGLLFPYFIYFSFHFLKGDLLTVWQAYVDFFSGFRLTTQGFSWLKIGLMGFMLLTLLIPRLMPQNYSLEKTIAVRSKIAMTYNLMLAGVLMLFFEGDPMLSGVLFLALSILFSYYMAWLDRVKWANITFVVLILLVLAMHYVPLFV